MQSTKALKKNDIFTPKKILIWQFSCIYQPGNATVLLMQNYIDYIIYRKINLIFLRERKSNCTLYPNTNTNYWYTPLYYMPGIVVATLHISHLILAINLYIGTIIIPMLYVRKLRRQRGWVTYPRSHSYLGFEPIQPSFIIGILNHHIYCFLIFIL